MSKKNPTNLKKTKRKQQYFRQAIEAIVREAVPRSIKLGRYGTHEMADHHVQALQDWCVSNACPNWSTGIGIIDAAERMVVEAVTNGNIPEDELVVSFSAEQFQTVFRNFIRAHAIWRTTYDADWADKKKLPFFDPTPKDPHFGDAALSYVQSRSELRAFLVKALTELDSLKDKYD